MRQRGRVAALAASAVVVVGVVAALITRRVDHRSQRVFLVPRGIVADCSVDVTAALQSWIARIPNHAEASFHGGCYRIDHTLQVDDRQDLIINGGGATFRPGSPTGDSSTVSHPDGSAAVRSQWEVAGSSAITFEDMSVFGSNPYRQANNRDYWAPLAHQHAFDIDGVTGVNSNITIREVSISNTYGDGIYLRDVTGARVQHDDLTNIGRQGITVVAGSAVLIADDTVDNVSQTDIDLEPNNDGNVVTGVMVRDNRFGAGRLNFLSAAGHGTVEHVTVTDNVLVGHALTVLVVGAPNGPRQNWTISDNRSDLPWASNSSSAPIVVVDASDVVISGNSVPLVRGSHAVGVSLSGDADAQIDGNSFIDAAAIASEVGPDDAKNLICGNRLSAGSAFNRPHRCDG